ncbi:hypothetical protein ACA910_002576 [Epithemia clementina (nom. ined.)]
MTNLSLFYCTFTLLGALTVSCSAWCVGGRFSWSSTSSHSFPRSLLSSSSSAAAAASMLSSPIRLPLAAAASSSSSDERSADDNNNNNNTGGKVQSISLKSMFDTISDPNEFAQELADSVQRWLDAEWMPQGIHKTMGQSCKHSLLECQNSGVHDLMAVMMTVANDLEEDWSTKYEQDAFVNPWDVTNYVSDYLTQKSGIEGCECSAKLH